MKKIFNKTLGIGIISLTILSIGGAISNSIVNNSISTNMVETEYSIEDIYGNGFTNFALDSNGDLWAWGQNNYGQVGNGTKIDQETPVQITGTNSIINPTITVAFENVYGKNNTFIALDENGDLWGWGYNYDGQVGNGNNNNQTIPIQITGSNSINPSITIDFVNVYENSYTFIALDSNGDLWGWGWNHYGQVGNGTKSNQLTPIQITGSNSTINSEITVGFEEVCENGETNIALDENGDLWGWGNNNIGQIGTGNKINQDFPIQITGSNSIINPGIIVDFVEVYGNYATFIALDESGDLWGWGNNSDGQVGRKNKIDQTTPIQITGSNSIMNPGITVDFVEVYENGTTNFALDENGDLWGW